MGPLRLTRLAGQLLDAADDRAKQEQALKVSVAAAEQMNRVPSSTLSAAGMALFATELDRANQLLLDAVHLVRACSSSARWRTIAARHGLDVCFGESPAETQQREGQEEALRLLRQWNDRLGHTGNVPPS